jgi:hypothetical protein
MVGVQSNGFIGSHPIWHYALVAAGAVGVFVGIKVYEHWHGLDRDARGAGPTGTPRAWRRDGIGWIVLVALASFGCSVIHGMVCPDHFHEATLYGVFFAVAATLQAAWGVAVLWRPARPLFVIGAAGNLAVVVLWVVTRTVGLPVGPDVWRPEAVSGLDALATAMELVVVAGATWLVVREGRMRRIPGARRGSAWST